MNGLVSSLEQRMRQSFYPSWVIHILASGLWMLDKVARYPLADSADPQSCTPLFIISAGRSGTTLLRSMLVAGGGIGIPPESYVIPTAIRKYFLLQHRDWPELSTKVVDLFRMHPRSYVWEADLRPAYERGAQLPLDERSLARLIAEIFRCYSDQKFPTATVWGDQSPVNTFYVSWLALTFPNAKFLHLLRDSRDVVSSWVELLGEIRPGMSRKDNLARATRRWMLSVSEARWLEGAVGEGQFLEVRYENLVGETSATLKKVCDFVGIEPRLGRMLDFWYLPTTIEHRYMKHHRNLEKPVFSDSVGKWRTRLRADEQAYVISKTGRMLEKFGYN